ncbi:MAG: peptidyl-prolyl cis-trans isomerase [Candidatus Cloacimonetes bacterium]|nr:peptidyl-prolyl cis-trans isomerase [Candidatus Cloacimonadota bacterium]
MKYVLIIFLVITNVYAETVSTVGSYKIDSEQLMEEMKNYKGNSGYSYHQKRNSALNDLINKQLLVIYAKKNGITVVNSELEAFFIEELGTHEKFQTNGRFDYSKFENFKLTSKGKKIIREMRKEILLNKIKAVIINSFNLSDSELLHQYFAENTEIDLNYATIDLEDANVSVDILMEEADYYFERNRYKFQSEKKVKLNFFIIFDDDVIEDAQPFIDERMRNSISDETELSDFEMLKLRTEIEQEEIKKLSLKKAIQLKEMLKYNEPISCPMLETPYLSINDKPGKLPSDIIPLAFEMKENQLSDPIDIGNGQLVFMVDDIKKIKYKNEILIANRAWKDFILKQKNKYNSDDYREYFETHIDKFIIPAAVITKIEFSKPALFSTVNRKNYRQKIMELIEENIYNDYELTQIIEEYNLKGTIEIIYLDMFENDDVIDNTIAGKINNQQSCGFISTGSSTVFYKINSYFPEFIPRYKNIQSQLNNFIEITRKDSVDYREYYESHKRDFRTPDSLRIGGVIIPVNISFADLQAELTKGNIFKEYQKNIAEYYREKSVKFEYIYTTIKGCAEIVKEQAESGIDFSLLQFCFGEDYNLEQNTTIAYKELPEKIQNALSVTLIDSFTKSVQFGEGWFVFHKTGNYNAGVIPFNEIKSELARNALMKKADKIAFKKAKAIFDSTTYFSQLSKYVEADRIFQTSYQDTELPFEELGSIDKYKKDLMRIWKNEKFSSVIKTNEGYAVIFILRKKSSKTLSYEESLSKIEEIYEAKKRFETAKTFVSSIKTKIAAGADPDSLLFYLSGWKSEFDLTLNSKIPGVEFSKIIMEDILKREAGYYSPVIPINEDQLLFYYISRLKRPHQNDFYVIKESYKNKILNREYKKWIQQYRAKIDVKIN